MPTEERDKQLIASAQELHGRCREWLDRDTRYWIREDTAPGYLIREDTAPRYLIRECEEVCSALERDGQKDTKQYRDLRRIADKTPK
jgi:hypothetical protein